MPYYDYVCTACAYKFDKILKMDDRKNPESESCPSCSEYSIRQSLTSLNIGDPFCLGRIKLKPEMKQILERVRSAPGASQKKTKFEEM